MVNKTIKRGFLKLRSLHFKKSLIEGKINSLPTEVYELGIHIATRLNILPRIVKRINAEITELFAVAAEGHKENNIFTRTKERSAYHSR